MARSACATTPPKLGFVVSVKGSSVPPTVAGDRVSFLLEKVLGWPIWNLVSAITLLWRPSDPMALRTARPNWFRFEKDRTPKKLSRMNVPVNDPAEGWR